MAEAGDADGYEEVLGHLAAQGLRPLAPSLRRMAVSLARLGRWELVDRTLELLEDGQKPPFLLRRLQHFRGVQGLEPRPDWPAALSLS